MVLRIPCAGWLHERNNSKCCSIDEDVGDSFLQLESTAKETKEVDVTKIIFWHRFERLCPT